MNASIHPVVASFPGFADAVCSHRPYLVNFARRRLRDDALAEDAVQETLLAALQGRSAFEHKAALRTWLTAILLRRIADGLRQQSRRPSFGSAADDAEGDEVPASADDDGSSDESVDWVDPQRRLEGRQFLADLADCLDELPPVAARMFTLREIDGLSNDEAAQALGLSARHSTVLLHRVRSSLRERLALRHAA